MTKNTSYELSLFPTLFALCFSIVLVRYNFLFNKIPFFFLSAWFCNFWLTHAVVYNHHPNKIMLDWRKHKLESRLPGLEEAQAGIKIAGRNINSLRYTDDTTLPAESDRSAIILMGIPLCVICCSSLAAFNICSLCLIFVNLINMCLGVFHLGFILFGTLWVSWTCVTISFPILGKFSAIISSSIFS